MASTEPEWWAMARVLRARGLSARDIGSIIGRPSSAVLYAVDEVYRERTKEKSKARGRRLYGFDDEYTERQMAACRERYRRSGS